MRFFTACLLIVTLCCAAPVAATGKTPQEYHILTSTTGDFPAISQGNRISISGDCHRCFSGI